MNELIEKLHEEGCSCVVNNQELRTYTHRGVEDLFRLLTQEPTFLAGADVADRVVGKAVAAMLIKGGVKNVYADLISLSALTLLRNAGVETNYDQLVTYIKNTKLTDWCPVEAMCYDEQTVDEILPIVQSFIEDKEKFFKSQS